MAQDWRIDRYKKWMGGWWPYPGVYQARPAYRGRGCARCLLKRLVEEDPTSVLDPMERTDPVKYLYRGQRGRYWSKFPVVGVDMVPADAYTVESIMPAAARGSDDLMRCNPPRNDPRWVRYGNEVMWLRWLISWGGVMAQMGSGAANCAWYAVASNHDLVTACQCVGQHYGLPTEHVDVSSDPRVAMYFATHKVGSKGASTTSELDQGRSEAVVYRFDLEKLRASADRVNRAMGYTNQERCEVVDLSIIDETLAKRPTRQRGWTLRGFEKPRWRMEAIQDGAVEVFHMTFSCSLGLRGHSHDYLMPSYAIDDIAWWLYVARRITLKDDSLVRQLISMAKSGLHLPSYKLERLRRADVRDAACR